MRDRRRIIILLAIWILLLGVALFFSLFNREQEIKLYSDFPTIQKRGYIRAGIMQNSTDYYVENGTVKGFHYELVELFAEHFNIKTRYIVYDTYWNSFLDLMTGQVDVLAMDLNNISMESRFFLYTSPHSYSSHVLVQRKDNMVIDKNFNLLLDGDKRTDKTFLLGIEEFTSFYSDALLLKHRLNHNGITISIRETGDMDETLDLLNSKEIDLTIANQKVMKSNAGYYRKLDYSVNLTDTFSLHWVMNMYNVSLQRSLNEWLDSLRQTRHHPILVEKYYSPRSGSHQTQTMRTSNSISLYDKLIKECAAKQGLDWRLVAAIIYRESKFNPHAIGKGGSYGLMQIMSETAAYLGMKDLSPESQVECGCKYIRRLITKYSDGGVDTVDLYKFVLAAYNAGPCHIDDARLLAKQKGYNPNRWQDVEKMLVKLSDKKYTKNVQLKCGNYNGKHAKKYVSKVWEIYRHYQNMSKEL
jgi:membrane-bound lytic murein transglycosylase F